MPEAVARQSSINHPHPPFSLPPQTPHSPPQSTYTLLPLPRKPTHSFQTHRPNHAKARNTQSARIPDGPRVDLINPVGGGREGWGERNLERCWGGGRLGGGEKGKGKREKGKGKSWHSKSFFSVGVERTRQGKARQGKDKDKENKSCIPQPMPKIPESPKCMKRFWRKGIKRGCWIMREMSVAGGQGGSGWV